MSFRSHFSNPDQDPDHRRLDLPLRDDREGPGDHVARLHDDAAHRMRQAATGTNFAAQVTGNITGSNRGEFRMATDPRPPYVSRRSGAFPFT